MRFFNLRMLSLVFLVGVAACNWSPYDPSCNPDIPVGNPGSCPAYNIPDGQYGGQCHGDGTCDSGLTCAGLTCLPCGANGEACCDGTPYQPGTCDSDADQCSWSENAGWWKCTTCGHDGEPCCHDEIGGISCVDGSTCEVDGCEGGSGPTSSLSCGDGPTYYVVGLDPACVPFEFTFTAPDDAAAAQCVADTLAAANPGLTFGPPSQNELAAQPQQYEVCPDGCSDFGTSGQTVYLSAFDHDQLEGCEYYKDPSCTSWTDGACP